MTYPTKSPAPVREPTALEVTEDPARAPDGVPHDIVWWTATSACVLAAVGLVSIGTAGCTIAGVVELLVFPLVVLLLERRADRERDQSPPSR